jgi:5-methylcytosine-specific restriction protein A
MNLLIQHYAQPKNDIDNNFVATIANSFDLLAAVENSKSDNKPDLTEFLTIHPDGKSKIWALGENRNNRAIFGQLHKGDLVLFHGNSKIYAYGEIECKMHWVENDFVWPTGGNWDYIYSLRNVVLIPKGSRIDRDSLRQLLPEIGHRSAFFADLGEVGISQSEILNFLDTTPPNVPLEEVLNPSRGVANPPRLGERFKDRLSIWRAFGGQWFPAIVVFLGDKTVNLFSDENGPRLDFIDPETGTIEFRGQELRDGRKLSLSNSLLEEARLQKTPVRFWYRPVKGQWEFKTWAVIEDRITTIDDYADNDSTVRLLWFLVPVPTAISTEWPDELVQAIPLVLPEVSKEKPVDQNHLLDEYKKRSEALNQDASNESIELKPKRKFKRRKEARDLVLARSRNICEHDGCTGMPFDIGRNGRTILEVDHIIDLANGGPDITSNMIALCPNCHKAKTFGKYSDKTIKRFQSIVKRREQEILTNS